MREKTAPTREDRNAAAGILARWTGMRERPDDAADLIRGVLEEYVPGMEKAYARRRDPESSYIPNRDLPQFLADMAGVELFEGKHGRRLRNVMLQKIRREKPEIMLDMLPGQAGGRDYDAILERLATPAKTRWIPGGWFAVRFVEALGLPPIFAGSPSEPPPDRAEEVYTRTPYAELENFQENMKAQILEILQGRTKNKRAIVSLPTGAGKTKTVAEAIVEFWRDGAGPDTRFVMWIAQTDELGEQAVACFRQLWEEKGSAGDRLNIFRAWGGRGIPYPEEMGLIVAGIDQLYYTVKETRTDGPGTSELADLGSAVGAVFIDEAHRTLARKYREVLEEMGIRDTAGPETGIPLIGLTATPERTARGETNKLRRLYGGKIIHPRQAYSPGRDRNGGVFDAKWSDLEFMKARLTELRFLARATHHWVDPEKHFVMSSGDADKFNRTRMLSPGLIREIGSSPERNNATYRLLKKWIGDEGRQVLFFGADVTQALLMSRFLEEDGFVSAAITGDTRYGTRRAYVRMFREGEIRALCNYEVLTTGFDVPKVDTVVIARPTSSWIVYQQMVGRGLRGPNFGGTETCDIITLEDRIDTDVRERVDLGYMKYREWYGERI